MSIKLLTEHHLEFLSLKEGCIGSSESSLVKMPNCGNHMPWLISYISCSCDTIYGSPGPFNTEKKPFCSFIDVSKAFDSVRRSKLWKKTKSQ